MKRGEIYWAHLNPRSGSEQSGSRPVIVLSNDVFNENQRWRSIIVVPISTSERQKRRGPSAIILPKGEGGLSEESVALCHQITTLDRSKLNQYVGALSQQSMAAIESGIKVALEIL